MEENDKEGEQFGMAFLILRLINTTMDYKINKQQGTAIWCLPTSAVGEQKFPNIS